MLDDVSSVDRCFTSGSNVELVVNDHIDRFAACNTSFGVPERGDRRAVVGVAHALSTAEASVIFTENP